MDTATDKPFVDPSAPATAPARDLHQEAYDYEPSWQGVPLEPFTMARQSLAAMLESHSPGVGSGGAMNEAYMPAVWSVLWLCHHTPDQWRHLRTQPVLWWEQIEEWAEEHCPRGLWLEAITLVHGRKEDGDQPAVLGMWDAARLNMIKIKRKPGPNLSGNVPRQ